MKDREGEMDKYIYVRKPREQEPWEVWLCTSVQTEDTYATDDLNGQKEDLIAQAESEEKAYEIANAYIKDRMPEAMVYSNLWVDDQKTR